MLLQPGPIPPISGTFASTWVQDPGFAGLEAEVDQSMPAIFSAMDLLLDPAVTIAETLVDDGTDTLISDASSSITYLASYDINPDMAAIDAAGQTSGDSLLQVYAATPAEAWEPVPPPADYSGPAPPANPTVHLTITINNLTRPGQSPFQPGDTIQFVVQLPVPPGGVGAYSGIDMQLALTFVPPGMAPSVTTTYDMGKTDAQGFIHYNLAIGPGDIGVWYNVVSNPVAAPDGTFFTNLYSSTPYTVVAAGTGGGGTGGPTPGGGGAPPPTTPVTHPAPTPLPPSTPTPVTPPVQGAAAKLSNITRPGTTDFILGDAWALQVVGPANSTVTITGTGPGGPLTPAIIGETDGTGTFNAQGYMGQADVGTWSETYIVGTETAQHPVNFTVYP